jgi:hypothetical protein
MVRVVLLFYSLRTVIHLFIVDIRNNLRNLIIYENCLDVSLFSRNVYTSSGDKTETSLCCCLEWRETKHWER